MGIWFRQVLSRRPTWVNLLMFFSAYMAIVYVPWDLFIKPVSADEEVWFGILFHGAAAKVLAVPHWLVYAAMAYGFWRSRPWAYPLSALYFAQVAFGMFIWGTFIAGGLGGFIAGVISGGAFAGLTLALWNERTNEERQTLKQRYGDWALVTGASAGLGVEFARELAREGVSVVLTARREDRLLALASELEKNFNVQTRCVAADLTQADAVDRIVEAVSDLPIGILINNAGFGHAGLFEKLDGARLRDMIQLNCAAPVLLTHALLPAMRERGRGAILVTGSIAGRQPLPLHAVYSATKGFDQLFGESLWGELQGSGVDVLVLEPGPTATEFQEKAGEVAHGGAPARDVVRLGLEQLGAQPSVIHGWFNWLRANAAIRLLPRSTLALIAKQVTATRVDPKLR